MNNLNNFKRSLEFTLKWEGGYVNDPKDPGGETKWGISKRAYPNLDIKGLTATDAAAIYANDYWDRCLCDEIPFPLCTAVFDTSVNLGPKRANEFRDGCTDCDEYIARRVGYYTNLVKKNPSLQKFMRGWLNRTNDLRKFCEISAPSDS